MVEPICLFLTKDYLEEESFVPKLLLLYTACNRSMGMESGKILDKQITASSKWDANHAAHQGRLNFQELSERGVAKAGSWSALINDQNQWLQVDLLREESVVTSVVTQGRNEHPLWKPHSQWVKDYKLQYSNNGVNFTYCKNESQNSAKVRLKMAGNAGRKLHQATNTWKLAKRLK